MLNTATPEGNISPKVISSFSKLLNNTADLNTLRTFQKLLEDRIEVVSSSSESEGEISFDQSKVKTKTKMKHYNCDLVKYTRNLIGDMTLLQLVKDELHIPYQTDDISKYLWLNSTNTPYEFGRVTYEATDISKFPAIVSILDLLNNKFNLSLDACLVSCYKSGNIKSPLHSDNEPVIDLNHSICNISIGPNRTIQFKDSVSKKVVTSIVMEHGSLVTMVSGCQDKLLHEVLPDNNADSNDIRYCLSFRKLAKVVPVTKVVDVDVNINNHSDEGKFKMDEDKPESLPESQTHVDNIPITHLIIGDSLTRDILPNDNTVTMTKGGARMRDIIPLLDKSDNLLAPSDYKNIKSVILCVGTNAINDLSCPLLYSFSDYDKVVRELIALFPNAIIGLFNIPPRFYHSVETYTSFQSFPCRLVYYLQQG